MTFLAARQILTESPGGVWIQPYGYPSPYQFILFDQQYVPYDLVEIMRAPAQLGATSFGW